MSRYVYRPVKRVIASDSGNMHCPMIGCHYSVPIKEMRLYWAHRSFCARGNSLHLDRR